MSPEKYLRLFDDLRRLVARKYRGQSTRVDFEKPAGRDRDRVVLAKRPADDVRPDAEALDEVLRRCRLRPLGPDWQELPAEAARAHLVAALAQSLLYPQIEVMNRPQAGEIAAGAIALLPGARFYANGTFAPRKSTLAFPTITDALQDTGVAIVNDTTVLIVWVQEDD